MITSSALINLLLLLAVCYCCCCCCCCLQRVRLLCTCACVCDLSKQGKTYFVKDVFNAQLTSIKPVWPPWLRLDPLQDLTALPKLYSWILWEGRNRIIKGRGVNFWICHCLTRCMTYGHKEKRNPF